MNRILAINLKSSIKRLALALIFSALFVIRALSQGTVTVTATITDSQGTVWTNAACTAIYAIPAGVNHITNTVTGQGISPTSIPCTADSSGHFSITLVSTTNIGPPISGTTFTVCANLPNAQCYTTSPINIGASTQDVSAQITATIPPPTIAGVLIPQAYADSEVNQSVATEYLRITDNTLRCYTGTWGACGAGSGGPPTGAAGGVLSGTYPNPGYAVPPLPLAGGTMTGGIINANGAYPVYGAHGLLAIDRETSAGTPVYIEIYPQSTDKPDEGNASVAGTVAWAEAHISSGGKIFVHEGSYTVSTTIIQSTQGVTLQCANPQSTTFNAGASFNSDMFHIGYAGAQRQGENVENCGFNSNNGQNTTGAQLHVRDVANSTFKGNYFKFAVIGGGVTVDATVTGIVQDYILNNFFQECVQECLIITNAAGQSPTDMIVDANEIGGSTIGDGTKPWVTYTEIGGIQFTNNHISGPGHTYGANFSSSSQEHSIISHNVIETINQHGILIDGEFFAVNNNTFYLVGETTSNTYADIYLQSASNITMTGNTFDCSSQTKNAIYSDQGTVYNVITGNSFANCTGYAIAINSQYAGGNVIGPNIYNTANGTVQQQNNHSVINSMTQNTTVPLVTVPGQSQSNGIKLVALANGPTPTITQGGTGASTAYSYEIVPKDINGNPAAASSAGTTSTGAATLNGTNYNIVSFTLISGAYSYDVYRTASSGTPSSTGLIGNVLSTAAICNNALCFNDTGLAGNSATAPSTNVSGSISNQPLTGTVTITGNTTALACASGNATNGTLSSALNTMVAYASAAGTTDTDVWVSQAYVSAPGTVTVQICTRVTDASPGAIVYNVRVIP